MAAKQSKVVGLCDVDANTLETCVEHVKDQCGDEARSYKDYREMLEKEKPEIVHHRHAGPLARAARHRGVEAGAHVFVEKPTGHTIQESRAMLKAAKDGGNVVQVGLHRRIGPHHISG